MPIDDIISDIESSVSRLVRQPVFIEWLGKNAVERGDYVVINDSFVYRATSTLKSQKHLVLRADRNGILEPRPLIAEGLRFNLDFKHYGKRGPKPPVSTLEEAASEEVVSLGELLFILIGEIHDTTVLEETIGHADFDTMYWDPNATDSVDIANKVITVRDVHDEAPLAEAITDLYEERGSQMPDGLLTALGIALDQLQDRAVASLVLPSQGTELGRGMTDSIVDVLHEQREQYASVLASSTTQKLSEGINEILRIAYNFASDATTYLNLIVSICDLKPIVLWGTIAEHIALSEAFKQLPWTRSRNKPSMKNYTLTISDSRNSAFHNLFPFRKSLQLTLPQSALQNAELRIFSEHGKKKDNRLSFQDRELIDLLTEFTRARERRVSSRFWQQNLGVMDATIALFSATNSFLKTLYASAQTQS